MRRVFLLLTFIFLICSTSFAQVLRFGVPNLEAEDKARFRYGFSLGINIVDANLKTLSNYTYPENISPDNEVLRIYSKPTPAFNVGILANMRLGEYFDLRFIPSFSIAHDINLYYQFAEPLSDPNPASGGTWTDLIFRKIECHYIYFPLFIKFKSSRMHNVRFYALAGGQVGINMMSAKNNKIRVLEPDGVLAEIIPIIKPYDAQVKGGFGFDFYTTYFKFTTEFKVAFGVINMLESDKKIKDRDNIDYYRRSPIVTGLQSLKSRTFTISFIFE
ncbi:MAG: PorT family protein [Bacteroidetes bacterium]|nr:PorT family protein [Bacteroidota bacterium]MCL2303663.1 PorT family protein [Lentimicrobiaceae bacterium]